MANIDKLTIFIDITLQKLKLNAAYTQQIAHTGFLSSSTKQTYRFDDPLLLYSEWTPRNEVIIS